MYEETTNQGGLMITKVKLDCEGEINCTFTVTHDDRTTYDYWSCGHGSPYSDEEGVPDLTDDEIYMLLQMWGCTNISPEPSKDEEWKRDFSEWEIVDGSGFRRSRNGGDAAFRKVKEWSEEC